MIVKYKIISYNKLKVVVIVTKTIQQLYGYCFMVLILGYFCVFCFVIGIGNFEEIFFVFFAL